MSSPQILGLGGHPDDTMLDYALGLARGAIDSFGPQLEGMRDGLGFLAGSACPHYDGEERRRPVYQRLVREGFPPGIALDDAAGAHYIGTELREVVTSQAGAGGYCMGPDGEEPVETRVL